LRDAGVFPPKDGRPSRRHPNHRKYDDTYLRSAFLCKTAVSIYCQVSSSARTKVSASHPSTCYRVISTLVAERGGSPVPLFTALQTFLVCPPCSPFASGLPTRGEPRRWHRAPAGELRRPTARSSRPSAESGAAPAAASTRSSRSRPSAESGAAPALQLGPTLGAEDRHPEGKQREDPPCGKAMVGNQFPPNGG